MGFDIPREQGDEIRRELQMIAVGEAERAKMLDDACGGAADDPDFTAWRPTVEFDDKCHVIVIGGRRFTPEFFEYAELVGVREGLRMAAADKYDFYDLAGNPLTFAEAIARVSVGATRDEPMTWGEFKQQTEAAGATDDMPIHTISFHASDGDELSVNADADMLSVTNG